MKHWSFVGAVKAVRRLFGKKPQSGLKLELVNLRKRYSETEDYLSRLSNEFWRADGVCCPSCGVPGYSELLLKQERREKRIAEIMQRLKREA